MARADIDDVHVDGGLVYYFKEGKIKFVVSRTAAQQAPGGDFEHLFLEREAGGEAPRAVSSRRAESASPEAAPTVAGSPSDRNRGNTRTALAAAVVVVCVAAFTQIVSPIGRSMIGYSVDQSAFMHTGKRQVAAGRAPSLVPQSIPPDLGWRQSSPADGPLTVCVTLLAAVRAGIQRRETPFLLRYGDDFLNSGLREVVWVQ